MKWTKNAPTEPGWYWYEDENYGPCPVHVDWTGFVELPYARQLEIVTACGDECYQPLGLVETSDGVWGDSQIDAPKSGDEF